ncbi:MAG: hypothetical protein KAG06_01235 [Methylococcales bacterium]|nr:hypothetical protein [Methylococcales bacterium]
MNNKFIAILATASLTLLTTACIPTSATGALNAVSSAATGGAVNTAAGATKTGSAEAVTYTNKTYGFSFTIPAGWDKLSGDPESKLVLFSRIPINDGCSFKFHINPMGKSFPAKASVRASLKKSKEQISTGKYISAKKRNTKTTLGWQVREKGEAGAFKRIIYQAYDAKNNYYNFNASANTEKFDACQPQLDNIMKSIKLK